jgi:hypothetical protein
MTAHVCSREVGWDTSVGRSSSVLPKSRIFIQNQKKKDPKSTSNFLKIENDSFICENKKCRENLTKSISSRVSLLNFRQKMSLINMLQCKNSKTFFIK